MSKKAVSTHLINRNDFDFGGKVMHFGGDFRQMLPIIEDGSTDVILVACVISSDLWKSAFHLPSSLQT